MDYLYENLGHERFQEFCNVLISKEFPHFQAFPVGQKDGGRDALVYNVMSPTKSNIVFQVKYVQQPAKIGDTNKWIQGVIKKEIPKINELIKRGAKQYYLLTNVRGTAALDTGTIDQANKTLGKLIKIPGFCWWREDISRRFEKDPQF